MRKLYACLMAVGVLVGCNRNDSSDSVTPESRARSLIAALSNASSRDILASEGVRTNLLAIIDKGVRHDLFNEWVRALLTVADRQDGMEKKVGAMIAAGRVLEYIVPWYMDAAGYSYEDCWDVRFRQIGCLDEAIKDLDPRKWDSVKTVQEESLRRHYYLGLVEYREQLIERHECNDLYFMGTGVPEARRETVCRRLESLIGRPVRRKNEIKALGFYVKRVVDKAKKRVENRAGCPCSDASGDGVVTASPSVR